MEVLVAVPTFESILPETFKSIYGLTIPDGVNVMFDFCKGYDCAKARNEIAKEAVKYDFDYVLMVDSDIILPSNTLQCLLENPVDICLGVYPRKNTATGQTEIFKLGYKNFTDENNLNISEIVDPGRMDIKGGGLGCALIKVSLFKVLPKPWFYYMIYPNGGVLSEDNYFCDNASNKGFKIQADTRVRCGHLVRTFAFK
nr:MAG TPA: TarM [Caudoviricetes sp.]